MNLVVSGHKRLYAVSMFAELLRDHLRDHLPALDDDPDAGLGSKQPGSAWPDSEPDWHGADARLLEGDPGCPAGAGPASDAAGGADGSAEGAELGSLSYPELRDRMVELVAERSRVEGEYLAVLGELTSRHGTVISSV